MTQEIEKSVLGSVRLDSDVWGAVRAMECSLNQYLRGALLGRGLEDVLGLQQTTSGLQEDLARHIEQTSTLPEREKPQRLPVERWRRAPLQKGDKTR